MSGLNTLTFEELRRCIRALDRQREELRSEAHRIISWCRLDMPPAPVKADSFEEWRAKTAALLEECAAKKQ